MAMEMTATEVVLRRDRAIVVAGLVVILALAWTYLFTGAGTGMRPLDASRMALSPGLSDAPAVAPATPMHADGAGPAAGGEIAMDMSELMTGGWGAGHWAILVSMWWVMMIAMMVPSAAPMILLYGRTTRHARQRGRMEPGVVPTAAFVGGYLAVWLGFSVLAAALQFGLERAGLVSAMTMWSLDWSLSAFVLAAAGAYQLSPLKHMCLGHCRSPVAFLAGQWRPGRLGAARMGIRHGAYCVGCCWALMALLFVGGIMNLLWIAGLTIFVLIEKVVPGGRMLARAGGAACIVAAIWIGADVAGIA